jgi:hypothetical protein
LEAINKNIGNQLLGNNWPIVLCDETTYFNITTQKKQYRKIL